MDPGSKAARVDKLKSQIRAKVEHPVTLARAVLVAALAGVLALPKVVQRHGALFAALVLLALILDGLDGWIARLIGGTTRFGARFDMEVDALLVLVLSIAVVLGGRAGAWVLAIGGMRYAFVLAGLLLPWLPVSLVQLALALSLAALLHSFGRDTLWLWRHRAGDSA